MKTPTKEQIEKVFNDVFTGEAHETVRVSFLALVERIVVSWEKIRNSPK